jgi:hypothetical protein
MAEMRRQMRIRALALVAGSEEEKRIHLFFIMNKIMLHLFHCQAEKERLSCATPARGATSNHTGQPSETDSQPGTFVDNRRVERARADLPITRGQWYTLEVAIKADTAACRVEGVTLFEHRAASSYHGHVGLWTKADSVTLLTGLTIAND